MMENQVLVVLVFLFVGFLIGYFVGKRKGKREAEEDFKLLPKQAPTQQTTLSPMIVAPAPIITPPVQEKTPRDIFLEKFLSVFGNTKDAQRAFIEAYSGDVKEKLPFDDAMFTMITKASGITAKDVAIILKQNGVYRVDNIARYLSDRDYHLNFKELYEILTQVAEADEGIDMIIEAINGIYSFEGNANEWLPVLSAKYTTDEIIGIIHKNTSFLFLDIIKEMKIQKTPKEILDLIKKYDVDLENEYDSFRETFDFGAAILMFRELGKSVKEIADIEYAHSEDSLDEPKDIAAAISLFTAAGFTKQEVLAGIWDSEITNSFNMGQTVEFIMDSKTVSVEEIAAFLKERSVDTDDLETELKDETNLPLKTRLDILSALIA